MRLLILGGTRFVGRHITSAALAAGHDVSLVHRGQTGADLFPDAEHLLADRDAGLSILDGRRWDATIDVNAYRPSQVDALARALPDGAAGRYAFISSVSAYEVQPAPGFDEDAALIELPRGTDLENVTDETYGGLKVLCERAAVAAFGPRTLLVRPTYVIGQHDYTGRLTYWVRHIGEGGDVLAPGPRELPIQIIDGRDLGSWVVSAVRDAPAGAFHTVTPAPPYSFGDLLDDIVAEVAPAGTRLVWVDADFLREAGLDDEALPLWGAVDPYVLGNTADPAKAYRAGLKPRPVRRSIRELYEAIDTSPPTEDQLTRAREAEMLAAWAARSRR